MTTEAKSGVLSRIPWTTFRSWAAYAALPLVGIVTAPILARALGPEGRGQLAAILQPLTVADAFAAIGVPAAITFFVGRKVHPRRLRKVATSLLTVSTLLVGLVLFIYSEQISRVADVPRPLVLLLWTSAVLGAFIAARRGAWTGLRRFGLLDAERVTAATLRAVFIALLFLFGFTMPFAYAVAFIGSGLIATVYLFRRFPKQRILWRKDTRPFAIQPFMQYSVLASLGAISTTLNNRLDQAILPSAVSASDLGLYSVAVTVAEVPLIIATVMNRNLLAEVSNNATRKSVSLTALTGIVGIALCCTGIAVTAPWLVPLAFGPSFASAVPLIWLLLVGTVVGAVTSAASVTMAGLGSPGRGSVGPACGAVVTALLLWIFWHDMTVQLAAGIAIAAQSLAAIVSGLLIVRSYRRGAKNENLNSA